MPKIVARILLATAISLFAMPSQAVPINWFSTGVDDSRNALTAGATDTHWDVQFLGIGGGVTKHIGSADFSGVAASDAKVFNPAHPSWIQSSDSAQWVGTSASNASNTSDPVGWYRFSTTFDLTGFSLIDAEFSFDWASDNASLVQLNGTEIARHGSTQTDGTGEFFTEYVAGTSGVRTWGALAEYVYDPSLSLLVAGVNTLTFDVFNADCGGCTNPSGLLVSGLGGEVSPVPVPAALPLMGLGLAGLGLMGWRRSKRAA